MRIVVYCLIFLLSLFPFSPVFLVFACCCKEINSSTYQTKKKREKINLAEKVERHGMLENLNAIKLILKNMNRRS